MHGVGIKDVAVAMTILNEEFFSAARGGERAVFEHDVRENFSGVCGIGNMDKPASGTGRTADGIDSAGSGGDERGSDVLLAENRDDMIDGIALANAAWIKLDGSVVDEINSSVCRIEMDFFPANLFAQRLKLGR